MKSSCDVATYPSLKSLSCHLPDTTTGLNSSMHMLFTVHFTDSHTVAQTRIGINGKSRPRFTP